MADSVNIPVQINVRANQQQLNNVSSQIANVVNKIKGFKAKNFFAPITNSAKTLSKGLKNIQGGVNNLSNSFAGLKSIASSALSLATLTKLSKEMISLSSDLVEVQNVVDTTFGEMADDIDDFAKSALKSFGLTELQAKQFSSTIGAIVKASGLSKDATLEVSEGITKLTGDVASFYNLDHEVAFEKLRSGITGETEPLKSLGVVMTVANLEAYRLSRGITTSYQSMSEAQKVALRYNFILDTLSDAQGDFAKTQGSWSNQVRILVSNVKQLGSVLGGLLQKFLYPILTTINQIVSLALSGASSLAKMFGFDMKGIQESQGSGDDSNAMKDLADNTDDAAEAQKKLNKEQKKSLANIHELNILQLDNSKSSETGKTPSTGVDFDLSKYKDVSKEKNPVNKLFKEFQDAIKNNDWEGLGAKLADKINGVVSKINLEQYIPAVENGVSAFAEVLNGLTQNINFSEIGRVLGEGMNLMMAGVNTFFETYDFTALGEQLATGLNSIVDTVDFTALGVFLTNGFNAAFKSIAGFVTTFDWKNLGIKLVEGVNSIVNSIDFDSFSTSISTGINGVVNTIGTVILNTDWADIGSKFAQSFSDIFGTIDYGAIGVTAVKGIESILLTISEFLADVDWDKIGHRISTGLNQTLVALTNINWLDIGSKFATGFSGIFSSIDYGAIGATVIKGVEGILLLISEFFAEIDFNEIFSQIADGFNETFMALGSVDWETLASNLSTGMINMISGMAEMLKEVDWLQLGINIYNGIKTVLLNMDWAGLVTSILELVFNALGALSATILPIIALLVADIIKTLYGISEYISEGIKATIALVTEFLGNIIGLVITKIAGLATNIATWFKTLVGNIGAWLINIVTKISEWFPTLVSKLGGWLGSVLSPISSWFTGLVTKVGSWLGKIFSKISSWFPSLISKLGGWLGSVLSPIVSLGTKIWSKFTGFLQKIVSYITGTFKSSWGSAWEGLKSVFTSIFKGIGGVFKGIINTVIDGINTVIGAINKIHFDVPDWVPGIGGKDFGFKIGKIPKLANGAVIPPNQEFLAVLGDQKRGVNIETPLETMLQAFRGALAEVELGGTGDIVIPIYINNELTSEEVIRKQEIARYRSNGK